MDRLTLELSLASDGRLSVRGPKAAEPVAQLLLTHKPLVLGVLTGTTPEVDLAGWWLGWWEIWAERAAIREHDGGQAREHAEAEALGEIMARMRTSAATKGNVNATQSRSGRPNRDEAR